MNDISEEEMQTIKQTMKDWFQLNNTSIIFSTILNHAFFKYEYSES